MRIAVDYRPALRARTGVGDSMHELVRAYARIHTRDDVVLFTSSWKDRPDPRLADELRAVVIDRRIPVRVLNLLWHRAEWPPIEHLVGELDVAHSPHPLLVPTRHAAQVVTIHDLFFLSHPGRTRAEIRRDYAALAGAHARRADAVITPSAYTKGLVARRLGVPQERIHVCPHGPPSWTRLGRAPNVPADGYILFEGTLEPRKNVGMLLDAYATLLSRMPGAPRLVLAGGATSESAAWLDRLKTPPLNGRAVHLGYVPDAERESVYAGARTLVLPSLDEGFGLPALAAMSAGVPVVASRRGSLPEVVDTGGILVDATDPLELATVLERLSTDQAWAVGQAHAGLRRAQAFSWNVTATALRRVYLDAIDRRRTRDAA